MTTHGGAATARAIAPPEGTPVGVSGLFVRPAPPSRIALPVEGTMPSSEVEFEVAAPFGDAVRRMEGGRLLVNMARLRQIYELTASDEKRKSDRGTCGRLRSDFVPEQSDYEDDRYE